MLVRPFERASVELALPAVALGHLDTPYLDLAAFVLGNCESSRLVRRGKEHSGLCDRIDAYSYTPMDPGVFSVDIDTDTPRALEAIGLVSLSHNSPKSRRSSSIISAKLFP